MMYGALFQLLGTAHWGANVRLRTETTAGSWTKVSLVIEPKSGGDVQIEFGPRRIVEQWKAKSNEGPWSLRELIESVFPDLLRAVVLDQTQAETEFRFVTEGHRGRWTFAESFFAELRTTPPPADPVSALDDIEEFRFFPKQQLTRRGFFREILASLRSHPDIGSESENVSSQKLWVLLGSFTMHGNRTLETIIRELDGFLLPLVDYREQVEAKRRELCTALLEMAASGDARISPQELLKKVHLDEAAVAVWAERRDALLKEVQRHLPNRWGYRREDDVRRQIPLPVCGPVVVLAGESGQGKTWRLASVLLDAFADGSLAVAIQATGTGDGDRTVAAKLVSRTVFAHDAPTDLELVAAKRPQLPASISTPWLSVGVDDVTTAREARELIAWNWNDFGMRLVISTLPPIARALQNQFGTAVTVINVEDFSASELREYLQFQGHKWENLPVDIRVLLRKPLLARLYCEIAEDGEWGPSNEYALFDRYWKRIRDDRNQADFPGDLSAMADLASTFLAEDVVYPWPQKLISAHGIDAGRLCRLEAVGWIRRLDDERVEVAHDRLLNWAVAAAIVGKRLSGEFTIDQLKDAVLAHNEGALVTKAGRTLAYVPMDVCWQLANTGNQISNDLPLIIAALEAQAGWRSEPLYHRLLPTLGSCVIGALIKRLEADAETREEDSLVPRWIARAIIAIGRQHPREAAVCGNQLLSHQQPALRNVGVSVLSKCPFVDALDRLWELHQESYRIYQEKKDKHWWQPYGRTFAAMRACVHLHLEWLESKINSTPSQNEPFSELAHLVATVPGAGGRELWRRVKRHLFSKVATSKRRPLVYCIQSHFDLDETDKLVSWLSDEEDLTSESAFAALVHLSPAKALEALATHRVRRLYMTRTWWLQGLLLRFPKETRDALRIRMEGADSKGKWELAEIYADNPDQMDEQTLNLLLDDLTQRCENANTGASPEKHDFFRPLGLLSEVNRPALLERFRARADGPLEISLTCLACSWGGRPSVSHDHEIDLARRILTKIAGSGTTKVVNEYLKSEGRFARLDGIEYSLIASDAETRTLLKRIACETEDLWEGTDKFPLLQVHATVPLAVLGENSAVVLSILKWGFVSHKLADVRSRLPPMTDEDISPAVAALNDPQEETRVRAVGVLSVSGRTDFAKSARQILAQAPPESELALAAVMCLDHFQDESPEALSLLRSQLDVASHAHAAAIAILTSGNPNSLAILETDLMRRGYQAGVVVSDLLVANLARQPQTRKCAAEAVWSSGKKGQFGLDSPHAIEALGNLNDPAVVEFLTELAFAPKGGIYVSGRKAAAIRGLARYDKALAFRACEAALRNDRHDLECYPSLLAEIDEDRAIDVLFRLHVETPSARVRRAIGITFRKAKDQAKVRTQLDLMLGSERTLERVCGLEISSWQESAAWQHKVRTLAITDLDEKVRRAGEKASLLLEKQANCLELLTALEKASPVKCWALLEAVISVGDVDLLSDWNDALSVGRRVHTKSPGIQLYTWKLTEDRRRKQETELDKLDKGKDND